MSIATLAAGQYWLHVINRETETLRRNYSHCQRARKGADPQFELFVQIQKVVETPSARLFLLNFWSPCFPQKEHLRSKLLETRLNQNIELQFFPWLSYGFVQQAYGIWWVYTTACLLIGLKIAFIKYLTRERPQKIYYQLVTIVKNHF